MKLFGFDVDESVKNMVEGLKELPETAAGPKQKPVPEGFGWKPTAAETQRDIELDKMIAPIQREEFMKAYKARTEEQPPSTASTPTQEQPPKGEQSFLETAKSAVESIGAKAKKIGGQIQEAWPVEELFSSGELPITKLGKAWLAGAEIQMFREGAWMDHAETDSTLIKPYFDKLYGGHTRTARNAGSFYGGYDAAMRFPDRLDELKTLAEVYQLVSAVRRMGSRDASWMDEKEDANANVAGIEAARRDIAAGKKYQLGVELNEEIIKKAQQYATTKTKK